MAFGNQTAPGRWRGFNLRRIRQRWSGRIVLKGVMAADDARRAVDTGVDAVYVSNHGGRQFDSQPSTAAALPAIAQVRRGSDVAKMAAMGATACLVGRPAAYGLAAHGSEGVGGFVGRRSFADVSARVLASRPMRRAPGTMG